MKLHIYTQDCCHDEPDSSGSYSTANNWERCFTPLLAVHSAGDLKVH